MSGQGRSDPRRPPASGNLGTVISHVQVRQWLDDSQFQRIDRIHDPHSVFNFRLVFSDQPVHVLKNRQGGPLVITAQLYLEDVVGPSLSDLSAFDRHEIEHRVHEQFVDGPALFFFLDESGGQSSFGGADRVRVERFIYPDGATQHELMNAIFEVAKRLAYVDKTISNVVEHVDVAPDE